MISALRNGRNITLIAPRRMGKTGLIKNVFYKLRKQQRDVVTLYMDIFPTQNRSEFIRLFAATLLGQLDTEAQKAVSRMNRFFKSLRPVITFDELTALPKVTVELSPEKEESSLKELFDYLASSDKPCIVAIDEFQQVAEYPEKGLEAALRSYIQFMPANVHFIFAGSKQHVMQEMFLSVKRPFYQSTQIMTLERIDRQKYYDFAAHFFNAHEWQLSEPVFNSLYDAFDGHTWYIQALLNRLYGSSVRRKEEVEKATERIIDEFAYAYETLLAAYSSGSVQLLKAIAKEGCVKEITAGEFLIRHRLKASSVQSAIKRLIDKELVYKTPDGYIVCDRFMAIWLRQQPF